jgi:osmotically-inducible protein OsmY
LKCQTFIKRKIILKGEHMMSRKRIPAMALVITFCLLGLSRLSYARVPDSDITLWVQQALLEDPRIDASEITFTVSDAIVTLSGSVRNLAAKKYADLEAKKINGVRSVINKIVVMQDFRFDTDIAQDVRHRIVNSAAIVSNNITVVSIDGRVTLSGEVSSWAEKEEAGLLASEVRGVTGVNNDLLVKYKSKRSDEEIKRDAVAALNRDVYLTGLPIDVSVKKGVVTLQGEVGNYYEKDRAEDEMSWLANVRGVKNDLKLKWREYRGIRENIPFPTDSELLLAVRAELDQDSRVNASNILVTASLGYVTLTGSVATHYQKRIAGADARDVVGVGWVSNNLYVRGDRRADSSIRADIISDLEVDDVLWDQHITVNVRDGAVTLSGNVDTWYDKDHATIIASRVRGVKSIVNKIEVEWKRDIADAALAENIKSRLNANWWTSPVSDTINVNVEKSVVTLRGTVHTWTQRDEARRVAFNTDGVRRVDNQLVVDRYDYKWDEW